MTTNKLLIRLVAITALLSLGALLNGCTNDDRRGGEKGSPASASHEADKEVDDVNEPMATAVVLGEKIEDGDLDVVQQAILDRLFANYRKEQGIEATDAEVSALVDTIERGVAADPALTADEDLTPEERNEAGAMRRDMARSMVLHWKTNRALYEQYGGRVIGQQFGPEPLDAYRKFLEQQQAAGAFAINDPDLRAAFWRYFVDDAIHDFVDPDAAAEAFTTPPWDRQGD